jgi:Cdc6-like AAA superfamily ATPase
VKTIATDTHTGVFEVKKITKDTQTGVSKVKEIVERVDEHSQRERSRQNLESTIQWLSPSDYTLQQVDLMNKRTKNTGAWFLESETFQTWRNGPGQTLFCPGIPGTGKTYISCAVIDHLRHEFIDKPDVGIAFIYLNYQPNQGQSAREVLACLLRQLIRKAGIIPRNVDDGLSKDRQLNVQPSLDAIMTALELMINHLSQTFMVIDALDECHSRDADELKRLLSGLVSLQQSQPFCLLATSRDISSIETQLKPHSTLGIRAQRDDIIHYVNTRIPSLLESDIEGLDKLQNTIRQKLLDATDGV